MQYIAAGSGVLARLREIDFVNQVLGIVVQKCRRGRLLLDRLKAPCKCFLPASRCGEVKESNDGPRVLDAELLQLSSWDLAAEFEGRPIRAYLERL